MREQFPEPNLPAEPSPVEPTKNLETDRHLDIPLFERLDEASQRFVLEIQALSEMSDEEFLAKYPPVNDMRENSEIDDKKRLRGRGIVADLLDPLRLINLDPPSVMKYKLSDQESGIVNMWNLVRLHLLEFRDSLNYNQPGFYEKDTEYLINQIFEKAIKNEIFSKLPDHYLASLFGLPDGDARSAAVFQDIADGHLEPDTDKKVKIIHLVITSQHQHAKQAEAPLGSKFIEDLWKYICSRTQGSKLKQADWNRQANKFYKSLSNLKLK